MNEVTARAFVLERRPFREHDLRVVLLAETGARVELMAPSGQQSKRRFAGGLSPLVLHSARWTVTPRGARLDETRVERQWPALWTDLTRQTAATAATGVALMLAEPHPHDATMFLLVGELYAAAADAPDAASCVGHLVRFVFDAMTTTGHGLTLDHCARCQNPAPDTAKVTLDPYAGGIVCRSCGGGSFQMSADDRAALRAVIAGDVARADVSMVRTTARLIEGVIPDATGVLMLCAPVFEARVTAR